MTAILIIILATVAAFLIALISPRRGTKIQFHTDRITDTIDGWLKGKPKIIRKLFVKPTNVSSKTVKKSAAAGKKTNAKLPPSGTK